MTAFFVPELDLPEEGPEEAYAAICQAVLAETGHSPRDRRIFKLAFRRGGADIEAEVGKPDPIGGEMVLAILDLGRLSPYVVSCGRPGAQATQIVVGRPVYDVTEFSSR